MTWLPPAVAPIVLLLISNVFMSREAPLPRAYIYAKRSGPGDTFRQFADRAKGDSSWKYYEMDASHNPHITCPQDLMATLSKIMRPSGNR